MSSWLKTITALTVFASSAASALALPATSEGAVVSPRATTQTSSNHCGDYDFIILSDTPWIVYNMLYNAAVTVGTQCTFYNHTQTALDGTQGVVWSSTTDIEFVSST